MTYFGCTYLCMLLVVRQLHGLATAGRLRLRFPVAGALLALLALNLVLGLANVFLAPLLLDAEGRDRLEDAVEWWAGASFTVFFCALAWLWKRTALHGRWETGA
jgi:hypothetical protein